MKRWLMRLVCLLLVFSLVSCGYTVDPGNGGGVTPPGGDDDHDHDTPGNDTDGYTFTVTLKYNGTTFIPDAGEAVTVQWKSGQNIVRADVDGEGRATASGLDGDYTVTLLTLPEGYTYDPNIHTANNKKRDITIELKALSTPNKNSGTGLNYYTSSINISKTGFYRATIKKAGQKLFFRFNPQNSGEYVFKSYVDTSANNVNPILYYYEGSNPQYLAENPTVITGGGEGFTSNFEFRAYVDNDNVSSNGGIVVAFAIAADITDGEYPVVIDFELYYEKDFEAGSIPSDIVVPEELDKINSAEHQYDKNTYKFVDSYITVDGQRIFEDDYYKLNPATGFYHVYDEVKYGDSEFGAGYGPILYAHISSPTLFTDAPFTFIEAAGNDALSVYIDGKIYNHKLFIEGIEPLLFDPTQGLTNAQATVGPYFCAPLCPCRTSNTCGSSSPGACDDNCRRCLDSCRRCPTEGLDCIGYAGVANSDGCAPVTEELKNFLQYFAISQSYFIDGGGWVETQADPPYHAGEDDQWLFACGYYIPK